jgi:hypothetical protein
MIVARALRAACATLFPIGASLSCADPGSTECSCSDPSVVIVVPADRAPSVSGVAFGGPACATSTATCLEPMGGGCARFAFRATGTGSCTVDVEFGAGPSAFEASLTFLRSACCAGFYPQVPSESTLVVPDLGGDAGGTE